MRGASTRIRTLTRRRPRRLPVRSSATQRPACTGPSKLASELVGNLAPAVLDDLAPAVALGLEDLAHLFGAGRCRDGAGRQQLLDGFRLGQRGLERGIELG